MASLVQITGDKELVRELGKLENKMKKKVLKPAIRTGLTPIQKEAKSRVPIRYGFLREEIKKKVAKSGEWGKIYVDYAEYEDAEGNISNPIYYAHLVEFGTVHSSATPFMRPARETKEKEALKRMANSARKKLKLPKI